MSLTTLLIYLGFTAVGWFLRHRGVLAQDPQSTHPLLDELEKLIAGKAEADRVLGQAVQKLGK